MDAIVEVAGDVHFGPLKGITAEQFQIGLNSKLLGQVNVTLGATSMTADRLRCAAIELKRDRRINSVSPNVLVESWHSYGLAVSDIEPVAGEKVALACRKSVEGMQTGQSYRVW